jgi:iron complex outermembrane receptor protein
MKQLASSVALNALLVLSAAPAFADDEAIVVTATKHGEAVAQSLPLSLNAFDADDLRARNVETLQSLSYSMPNIQLEDIGTARGIANFSIRGLGVNSSIPSVDPAVGLFVDGVYQGLNAGSLTDLFDVDDVEVLRGPQGTLYGRNVTGGAVLVRTRLPSDTFEIDGRVAAETGPAFASDVSISGPLVGPALTGRLSLLYANDSGWFRNDRDASQFGANEAHIYRGSLRFRPTSELELVLRGESGRQSGDGPATQNHALFSGSNFDFSIDNRGYARTTWDQLSLEANWRVPFGDGTITSISAVRDVEVPWAADIDSTPNFVFHSRILNEEHQRSQELRYAGAFGPLALTTGLYYFDEKLLYLDERNFSPSFRRVGGGLGRFESWAAFANGDWRFANALSLDFGLRYSHEHKVSQISRVRRAADDLNGPGIFIPGEGIVGGDLDARTLNFSDAPFDQTWDDLSPHVGLQWQPAASTNLYATWSRGFRAGGANFRTSSLGLAPLAYDPEETSAYEIGWKQDAFARRAHFDLAFFHTQIANMQRETNLPDPISGVQQIVLNAGDATLYGGEFEARIDLTDALTLSAQAGYTHGAYDRVTADLNGDLIVNEADRHMRIPRLAPWTYGLAIDYHAPLWGGDGSARLGINHRDASFYNDTNLGRLASADMIDVNLSYAPRQGGWRLSLYGDNLLNEVTWGGDTILPSTAAFGYSGGARPTFSPLNRGRVIGVELRVSN